MSDLAAPDEIIDADVEIIGKFPQTFDARLFFTAQPVGNGAGVDAQTLCQGILRNFLRLDKFPDTFAYQNFHIDIICLWAYNIIDICPWANIRQTIYKQKEVL